MSVPSATRGKQTTIAYHWQPAAGGELLVGELHLAVNERHEDFDILDLIVWHRRLVEDVLIQHDQVRDLADLNRAKLFLPLDVFGAPPRHHDDAGASVDGLFGTEHAARRVFSRDHELQAEHWTRPV